MIAVLQSPLGPAAETGAAVGKFGVTNVTP